jgi:manganese oxidase
MFVNKMDYFYASMHSMGLFYTKESEGSIYYNGTESDAEGNAVPPGGCAIYKWYALCSYRIGKRLTNNGRLVGPGSVPDAGMDSKMWAYHSYVSMYQDADAGLSGPVIVYNPGKMNEVMANNREFIIFYGDNQESNSFLALHNVQKYLPHAYPTIANMTSEYPKPTVNQTFWQPQMINTPLTNVTTTMAPNFFPVCCHC